MRMPELVGREGTTDPGRSRQLAQFTPAGGR